MEQNIQIFNNESFGTIRVAGTSVEPLFCLADLCSAIGVVNHRNVKTRLDESDVRSVDTPTYNQHGAEVIQPLTYVTESGMYDVIIRSDAESAKPFRRWVTSEVLPTIRKTGSYVVTSTAKPQQQLTMKDKLTWVKEVQKMLKLNDASTLGLLQQVADPLGLPVPQYVDSKGILVSASSLLLEFNQPCNTAHFNSLMIKKGFLEELSRRSSKGINKKFKHITPSGLKYGENQVNPKSPQQTQPLYYKHKFPELLKELGLK